MWGAPSFFIALRGEAMPLVMVCSDVDRLVWRAATLKTRTDLSALGMSTALRALELPPDSMSSQNSWWATGVAALAALAGVNPSTADGGGSDASGRILP